MAEAFYNPAKEVFDPTSIVGYYADPNSCVGGNKDPEYFLIRALQMNEDLVTLIGNEDPCALSDNSVSNDSVLGKVIQQKQAYEQKFQTQEQFNSLISTHQQS